MRIEAIIFDKDGTLLDFDAFWIAVSVNAIRQVLADSGCAGVALEPILIAIGVQDGKTDMNGVLCKGTYREIGEIVHDHLVQAGCTRSCEDTVQQVIAAYNRHMDAGEVRPTCPTLKAVLTHLKAQGIKLAVVTTDNAPITRRCLEKLGILDLFDAVYTDDGKTPVKPDPACAEDFMALTGATRETTVMVGDTMTDVRFAKNAGIRVVGIAQTAENRAVLLPHADAVIADMAQLPAVLNCGDAS